MTETADQMELPEEAIRRHYPAAEALLNGFDHAPRLGKAQSAAAPVERSSGIGTRPRFRPTTPGLVTRPVVRQGGVHLTDRILNADDGDALPSPLQAVVLRALRRALAIAMALGEELSSRTGASALKKDNLEGRLPAAR